MVFDEILESFQKKEKRDGIHDCRNFLKTSKIKYEFNYSIKSLKDIPTFVPVNHYCRNFLQRKSLLTTIDSIITVALVTVGLSNLTTRKTTWILKNNLDKTFPYKFTKLRKVQLAAIYCYDLIGVSQNYPFSKIDEWENKLKRRFNIAFFPEGSPSRELKQTNGDFEKYLALLKEKIGNIQILPTSVYYTDKTFFIKFHRPMAVNKTSHEVAKSAILKIAESLPPHMRGHYKTA